MSTDARLRMIRARLGSLLRELDDEPPAKPFVITGDSATDEPGPVSLTGQAADPDREERVDTQERGLRPD
jgi:hypothetical protein